MILVEQRLRVHLTMRTSILVDPMRNFVVEEKPTPPSDPSLLLLHKVLNHFKQKTTQRSQLLDIIAVQYV